MASKEHEEKLLKRFKKERSEFKKKDKKYLKGAKDNSDFAIRRDAPSFKHKKKEALESAKKDKKELTRLLKLHKKTDRMSNKMERINKKGKSKISNVSESMGLKKKKK